MGEEGREKKKGEREWENKKVVQEEGNSHDLQREQVIRGGEGSKKEEGKGEVGKIQRIRLHQSLNYEQHQ